MFTARRFTAVTAVDGQAVDEQAVDGKLGGGSHGSGGSCAGRRVGRGAGEADREPRSEPSPATNRTRAAGAGLHRRREVVVAAAHLDVGRPGRRPPPGSPFRIIPALHAGPVTPGHVGPSTPGRSRSCGQGAGGGHDPPHAGVGPTRASRRVAGSGATSAIWRRRSTPA